MGDSPITHHPERQRRDAEHRLTADGATGARTAELWYKPWGESRGTAFGVTPTARRFTGQVLDGVAGGSGTFGSRRYER